MDEYTLAQSDRSYSKDDDAHFWSFVEVIIEDLEEADERDRQWNN